MSPISNEQFRSAAQGDWQSQLPKKGLKVVEHGGEISFNAERWLDEETKETYQKNPLPKPFLAFLQRN